LVSLSLNRLLAELTTPLECLGMVGVATGSNQSSTATQQVVIYKLTQLLCNAKESFLNGGGAMLAVLHHVCHTLEKVKIVLIDPAQVILSF
jgi:hypothetical protein